MEESTETTNPQTIIRAKTPSSSKNHLTIVLVAVIAAILGSLGTYIIMSSKPADQILFEKDASWGPCPPAAEPCSQSTKLYNSGRLVIQTNKNVEKYLNKNLVDQVIIEIRQSGIMDKSCEHSEVVDYSATYKINLDGREKIIRFPACDDELKKIESLFPPLQSPALGGV